MLGATAFVLVGAMLGHLGMVFLSVAPPNAVTARYGQWVHTYVQPEFGQDWKLFAPNPLQRNEAVGFRLRTRGDDGVAHTSPWVNLTDRDLEAIRSNPAPSHVDQNLLRRAWTEYVNTHDARERSTRGLRGDLTAAYLKRVVLQRIGREWRGEPITGLQIGGRFTMIPPPSWSSEEKPDTTNYRILPWWPVTDEDDKGL